MFQILPYLKVLCNGDDKHSYAAQTNSVMTHDNLHSNISNISEDGIFLGKLSWQKCKSLKPSLLNQFSKRNH